MEETKLRIKIGPHEFEASGPPDSVQKQFEDFKHLVEIMGLQIPVKPDREDGEPEANRPSANDQTFTLESLGAIFSHNEKRQTISLRIPPPRDEQYESNSALLILCGYLHILDMEDVAVGNLKASLQESGVKVDRVDRIMRRALVESLVIKTGSGRGGRYRLTTRGRSNTEALMGSLLTQVS